MEQKLPPTRKWLHTWFWLTHLFGLIGIGLSIHAPGDATATAGVLLLAAAFIAMLLFVFAVGRYAAKLKRSAIVWGGITFITLPFSLWGAYLLAMLLGPEALENQNA